MGCSHSEHSDTRSAHGEGTEGSERHPGEVILSAEEAHAAGIVTETVAPRPFRSVIRVGGRIEPSPSDERTLSATAEGIVSMASPSLTEGSAVRSGTPILYISARSLQSGDPTRKSHIALESAEREYERAKNLVADKIISTKEFEQIRARYETARESHREGAVTARGIAVSTPISGYLKSRMVKSGDYVSPGQPLAVITQTDRLMLRADVPPEYFSQLAHITGANFRTLHDDALHKLEDVDGKVLSYAKTLTEGDSFLPVSFDFKNVGNIIPGSYVEVYLLGDDTAEALTVPLTALSEEQGLIFVYLRESAGVYRKQEIQVGADDGERIQVLSGIRPGDEVVTEGTYRVRMAGASGVIPGHTH